MILQTLVDALEKIAPLNLAEDWDNVGLLVGDPSQPVRSVLLTIDYTTAVAAEAHKLNADAVIAYHPPIFEPLKRIVHASLIYDAIRRGIAIYSPHTALDVAPEGTNDLLASAIGLETAQPLRPLQPKSSQYKLVVFIPESHLDQVSQALFAAGAGQLGNYSNCSFQSKGTGTFQGDDQSNPAVGKKNKLESVKEVRLETILPTPVLHAVLSALKMTHPYEEPAFDLIQLAASPSSQGIGRIGHLSAPTPRQAIFDRIKSTLGLAHLLIAGPMQGLVSKAAVCAGACGKLLEHAISQKADLYLTGEMRHHDALKAAQNNLTVVCTLHSNSERAILNRLKNKLAVQFPELKLSVAQSDFDPFTIQ